MVPFRLIVGLGNPGRDYAETRHNVGFMILDRIAAGAGASFQREKKSKADVAIVGGVWLCKPQKYMNLSGECVRAFAHFHKVEPAQVLVVLDDMALPLGRLRLREGGTAGGHNGLQSVLAQLGTQSVARLRIGIGAADPGAATGHVLGRFALTERVVLVEALSRAVDAIAFAQDQGFPAAMNRFNQTTNQTTS